MTFEKRLERKREIGRQCAKRYYTKNKHVAINYGIIEQIKQTGVSIKLFVEEAILDKLR